MNTSVIYKAIIIIFFSINHQENLKKSSRWSFNRNVLIKIYYHIILFFDSIVFLGSGFHNPSYLEMKKIIFQILASIFQNISTGNFQTFSCSTFFFFLLDRPQKNTIFLCVISYYVRTLKNKHISKYVDAVSCSLVLLLWLITI